MRARICPDRTYLSLRQIRQETPRVERLVSRHVSDLSLIGETSMKLLIVVAAAAALAGGSVLAQDATTRGGANSAAPGTPQNSPATGPTTPSGGATSAPSGATGTGGSSGMTAPTTNPPAGTGAAMPPRPGENAGPPSQNSLKVKLGRP